MSSVLDEKEEMLARLRAAVAERLAECGGAERIEAERESRNRDGLARFFPDTGPFRRELYPRSLEFFALGATTKERALLGANRCCTAGTLIETDGGPMAMGELFRRGEPFKVVAWDGSRKVIAEAEAPFRKDRQEECVRLTMSDGRWVECSVAHRVLGWKGWIFVGSVCPSSDIFAVDSAGLLSAVPIGLRDVYDFEVADFHNYFAGGLIHHNSGKTVSGSYEAALHATGLYPRWWNGRVFSEPTNGWACGTTAETARDIVQAALLGPPEDMGTGMIPARLILEIKKKRGGITDAVDTIIVKHISGGKSTVRIKQYAQGRKSFEGTAIHWIWPDEEPPGDIYSEMLMRLVTTKGILFTTFTMMKGYSDVVKGFVRPPKDLPEGVRAYVKLKWSDNPPHLDDEERRITLASIPKNQRAARTEAEVYQNAGLVYAVDEEEIKTPPFDIPATWKRVYALDVGWRNTACLWMAEDPKDGTLYAYEEYLGQNQTPSQNAAAIMGRGRWIHGVIDPSARNRTPIDGQRLIQVYAKEGLVLMPARNAAEAGIQAVLNLMANGRLKIFSTLEHFWEEYRGYHRAESEKIVKKDDHFMDCFIGRTKVTTNVGEIPIRELGRNKGAKVLGPTRWSAFEDCKKYRKNAEVITLWLSDGREVTCTPDHLFMRNDGSWVQAVKSQDLAIHDVRNKPPFVRKIVPAGFQDVWCLTAPEESAFAVEGGLIAHNCMKYLVLSGRAMMRSFQTGEKKQVEPQRYHGKWS